MFIVQCAHSDYYMLLIDSNNNNYSAISIQYSSYYLTYK